MSIGDTAGRAHGRSGVIAVAPQDPLDPATFSGLSAHLFASLAALGVAVSPVRSRSLRWHDAVTGAVNPVSIVRHPKPSRAHPRVRPDWYWSRRGFERFCRRFDDALAAEGDDPGRPVLQVGTHVRPRRHRGPFFCLTDCTVPQAIEAGNFAVSRASPRVVQEAVACQREVAEACTRLFVTSEWARQSAIDDLGCAPDHVVVVGAGANLEVSPGTVEPGPPTVLFVGRDWEQKGGPLVLEGFVRARRTIADAHLVVVGCTPDIDADGVTVVGPVDASDAEGAARLARLYASATCFSILSDFDAFPNVLLEAGSAGVPVVTTRDGSRPEIVVDGETGVLIDRDADAVAAAFVGLLGDRDRAAAMGSAGRARVLDRFTWSVVGRHVADQMGLLDHP